MFHKAKRTCMLEHREVERLVLEPITCNYGNKRVFKSVILMYCYQAVISDVHSKKVS